MLEALISKPQKTPVALGAMHVPSIIRRFCILPKSADPVLQVSRLRFGVKKYRDVPSVLAQIRSYRHGQIGMSLHGSLRLQPARR